MTTANTTAAVIATLAALPERYRPTRIELQLGGSSSFTARRFGQKVKALGGRYNECRGLLEVRGVHLELTPAGIELAQELLREFPASYHRADQTPVVYRGFPGMLKPWATVQKGEDLEKTTAAFVAGYEQHVQRGLAASAETLEAAAQTEAARVALAETMLSPVIELIAKAQELEGFALLGCLVKLAKAVKAARGCEAVPTSISSFQVAEALILEKMATLDF